MKDEFTEHFFKEIDSRNLREEVASELQNSVNTLSKWKSIGIPTGKRFGCQAILDRIQKENEPTEPPKFQLYFEPDHAKFTRWSKKALAEGMTLEDWAFSCLDEACDDYEQELGRITPISRVAEDEAPYITQKAHLQAAAGAPIGAEVIDWESGNDSIMVKINGLSMLGVFHDGDVVEMKLKKASRSPYMKKGLVYLVQYDGGYTVKVYNTRPATEDELGEEYVENGKVKVLQSTNPEYSEIIIKQPLEWVAWYDKEVDIKPAKKKPTIFMTGMEEATARKEAERDASEEGKNPKQA